MAADAAVCIICLDSNPPPIQSGCACRSDSGLAHVACLIEKAVSQQQHRGSKAWWECQTCGQCFTGTMQTELGEARWSRVCDQAEESGERLSAAGQLAGCRRSQGKYKEAERIECEVLRVQRRVLGEEHLETLKTAARLALSICIKQVSTARQESSLMQSGLTARYLARTDGYSARSTPRR